MNGRGSCLVSEWSPVAWVQELSRGGGDPGTGKRDIPSVTHSSFKPLCPKHPQATIENTVLPGPDDGMESWEMGDGVGTPCTPETPIWVALDFGGPLKEKKGLREGHEEGVGR